MTKAQTIKKLNEAIDLLIIQGKTHTMRYKQLIRLHYQLTH